MTDFDKDLIISLSKLLEETGLSEIEIENKDVGRIKVAKNLFNSNILTAPPNNTNDNLVAEKEDSSEQKDLSNAISSPMVGTIYLKPDPESEPFVNEGDKVKKGDTLLIIEAMKTMNPIESNLQGKIIKIFVQNEEAVEFNQPLMLIE